MVFNKHALKSSKINKNIILSLHTIVFLFGSIISTTISCSTNPTEVEELEFADLDSIPYDKLIGKMVFSRQKDINGIIVIDASAKKSSFFTIPLKNPIIPEASVSLSPRGDKIVYSAYIWGSGNDYQLYTIDLNGKQNKLLVFSDGAVGHPVWSSDGNQIYYIDYSYIPHPDIPDATMAAQLVYSILPDGSQNSRVTNFSVNGRVSISKDENIVVLALQNINLFNRSNSSLIEITSNDSSLISYSPVFSPDEAKIAYVLSHGPNQKPFQTPPYFSKIMTIDIDGNNEMSVIELPFEGYPGDTYVIWSPDGRKLAFNYGSGLDDDLGTHIFTINTDGTELTQITNSTYFDGAPSWIE